MHSFVKVRQCASRLPDWLRSLLFLTLLAAPVRGTAQDLNARIHRAYDMQDWPTVASLQLKIIEESHFSFGNGRAYVDAMAKSGRAEEALKVAARWRTNENWPGGDAVYADALMSAGWYEKARSVLRPLKEDHPSVEDARHYLESLLERASSKTYRLTWQIKAEDAAGMAPEWYDPPQNTANQKLLKLDVGGAEITKELTDDLGNRQLRLTPSGNGPITVTALVRLTPMSAREKPSDAITDLPESVKRFLLKSPGIDPTLEPFQQFAASISSKSYRDRILAVMEHANKTLTYCPPGSPAGLDKADAVVSRGGGHCEALTMAICAYLRAAGIPARMIRGDSAIVGEGGTICQHTITQYWLPGTGWMDWDHTLQPFDVRADYVRHGAYAGAPMEGPDPNYYFQGREFRAAGVYRNGPYTFARTDISLD